MSPQEKLMDVFYRQIVKSFLIFSAPCLFSCIYVFISVWMCTTVACIFRGFSSTLICLSMSLCFLLYDTHSESLSLVLSAIAPDFSQNLLKAQTLARQGGDVLIECKPRMSPRGVISWRKGKEALRESYRYGGSLCIAACLVLIGLLFSLSAVLAG